MTGVSLGPLRTARRVQIALLVCGLIATGCQATKMRLWSWETPGIGQAGEVQSVTKRASYLDATLKVQDQDYRFLFPGGYECTQVIKAGAEIEYAAFGHIPAVRGSQGSCDPIGILSLKKWVTLHPKATTPEVTSPHEVEFKLFYRDDDVALVRGQFQFARRVVLRERGARGTKSLSVRKNIPVIAILPNAPECEKLLADGKAMGTFSADEAAPYRLLADPDVCPIIGFARVFQVERPVGAGRDY